MKNNTAEKQIRQEIENNPQELQNYTRAVALRKIKNYETAEEISNLTLFKIWANAGSYEPFFEPGKRLLSQEKAKKWVSSITENCIKDYIRKTNNWKKKHALFTEKEDFLLEDSIACQEKTDSAEESEKYKKLREAVSSLTKKQKETIEKVYYQGMNRTQAARELSIGKSTVSMRISQARKALRRRLNDYF